jgi:serine/threonine protein kinase
MKEIGHGLYAIVTTIKKDGLTYAIKIMEIEKIDKTKIKKSDDFPFLLSYDFGNYLMEYSVLKLCNHKNVLKYISHNINLEKDIYSITLELGWKNLKDFIKSGEEYDKEDFIKQVCEGYYYLLSKGIINCDIKTENVIVFKNKRLCICDFGLAKIFFNKNNFRKNLKYAQTELYKAPELFPYKLRDDDNIQIENEKSEIDNEPFVNFIDHKMESWSLGLLIYEIENGKKFDKYTYEEDTEYWEEKISQKKFSKNPILNDLISKLLDINQSTRLGIEEIFDHDFFKSKNIELPVMNKNNIYEISMKNLDILPYANLNENYYSFCEYILKEISFKNYYRGILFLREKYRYIDTLQQILLFAKIISGELFFIKQNYSKIFKILTELSEFSLNLTHCPELLYTKSLGIFFKKVIKKLDDHILVTRPNLYIEYYTDQYDKEILDFAKLFSTFMMTEKDYESYNCEQLAKISLEIVSKNKICDFEFEIDENKIREKIILHVK